MKARLVQPHVGEPLRRHGAHFLRLLPLGEHSSLCVCVWVCLLCGGSVSDSALVPHSVSASFHLAAVCARPGPPKASLVRLTAPQPHRPQRSLSLGSATPRPSHGSQPAPRWQGSREQAACRPRVHSRGGGGGGGAARQRRVSEGRSQRPEECTHRLGAIADLRVRRHLLASARFCEARGFQRRLTLWLRSCATAATRCMMPAELA